MRILILALAGLLSGAVHAQNTKMSFRLMQLASSREKSAESVSVLVKGDVLFLKEEIRRMGGTVKFTSGDICSAILPAGHLHHLAVHPRVVRMEEGRVAVQTLNDKMLINNRIDQVHLGASPLSQGYDGSGVLVGVIDTGIDFTHPDFKDSLGQSRVLWVWDHLLPISGNTPLPFNYGQEFSKADIDAGNASAHVDQTAHGTHVAGIAAANGDSIAAYKGAAPKAGIIAVSLNFNQGDDTWLSSIADAVDYIFSKADSLNQPCVINISAGTYLGSHDGKDLQAQAIDNLITAQNGRMVVAAAGNAGNYPLHLRHTLNNDTLFTWFRQTSANPIYIEFWSDTADLNGVEFTLGADQTSPGFQDRAQQNWTGITAHLGVLGYDTIWSYNGNRLATVQSYGQLTGDRYCMTYAITPDSATYYFRLMTKGSGKTDLWSFEMVSTGLPNVSIYPAITNYKLPDLQQNICSSFQCSDVVLCVGQYVNRNNYIDVNGNVQTFATIEGALAASSSRGPTRDGRSKPDITSTGEVTLSALKLSSVAWFMANQPFKLAQSGIHIRDGGTSSAAPVVAGAIALYFQKNPQAGWQDIRNRVLLCSKRDNFTGNNLPNNNWGYGKLDALSMTAGCTALSVNEIEEHTFFLYPNPSQDRFTIHLPSNKTVSQIQLFNYQGKLVKQESGEFTTEEINFTTQGINCGVYFLRVYFNNGKTETKAIVIE